jgi:voltage-gated potassium channel
VRGDRREALERFERAVELPLLVMALVMVPLLVVPLAVDLSPRLEQAFVAADWFVWAAFAFEYVVRLCLTDRRWRFVRREWPDLLIVILPFLRPLRIVRSARALRLLRLGRLVTALTKATREARRLLIRHRLHHTLLITMVVVVGTAALALAVEDSSGGPIRRFGDALWWALTTVTTVGYGDTYPVTSVGRGLGVLLMVVGVALLGVLSANLAAFLLEPPLDEEARTVDDRLDEILQRLAVIERQLSGRG